jgi:hypothetical protein
VQSNSAPSHGNIGLARACESRSRGGTVGPVVLTACVAALYGWTVWFGFVNDDFAWVQRACVVPGVRWWRAAFVPAALPLFFRPVVQLSFYVNCLLFGSHPFGYHLTNVILEGVNVLLVWRLARAVFPDALSSLLVALVFLAHASLAVAVSWVCARGDLLCAAFFVAGVLAHCAQRTWVASGYFALALLSKETAAPFPVVALAIEWLQPTDGRWWRAGGAYVAVLAAYLGLRAVATTDLAPPIAALALVADGETAKAALLVGSTLAQAARCLLTPLPLGDQTALVGLCVLVAGCLWATWRSDGRRVTWFGIVWMMFGLAPFLGHFTFSAYYVYLASIGYALMVVSAGRAVAAGGGRWRRRLAAVCVTAWIIASVVALEQRTEQHRRNALMSSWVVDAIVRAVPHPPSGALFQVSGIGPLRLGRDPWARSQVLLFGLPEALRLRFDDPTLDVTFDAQPAGESGRPLISLRWDSQAHRMVP